MRKLLVSVTCFLLLALVSSTSARMQLPVCAGGSTATVSCTTEKDAENVSNNEFSYMGKFSGYEYMGWQFTAGSDYTICGLKVKVRKYGAGQDLTLRIYSADTAATPDEPDADLTGGGATISAATLTTSLTEHTVSFSTTPALSNGTTYFIVFSTPTYSGTDYIGIQRDGNGGLENGMRSGNGSTWASEDTQNSCTFWTYSE